ncbi:rrna processing protein rrp17 [Diaporthe eres]|uniref:Nucleolar protein 12 n=1 Tax=Diaporthe vaccinii TaxID=105482 RepID=A0ABR4F6N3_9PEZI|nr:rrna processing protein rrp17 [Diaporthe eres]
MFAKPRPKKSLLPPPSKKRKATHTVEEINFDNSARQEYLTGFHKRKVQRQKHAQEEAAKRAREEKIEFRKQLREDKKKQVEEHVKSIEAIMKESRVAGLGSDQEDSETDGSDKAEDEWNGFDEAPQAPALEAVDHEEEYIDEDLYTTVKVEAVSVDRDGLHNKSELEAVDDDSGERSAADDTESKNAKGTTSNEGRKDHPKKKKKKFRYETKVVRQMTNRKNKARKSRG